MSSTGMFLSLYLTSVELLLQKAVAKWSMIREVVSSEKPDILGSLEDGCSYDIFEMVGFTTSISVVQHGGIL